MTENYQNMHAFMRLKIGSEISLKYALKCFLYIGIKFKLQNR